MEESQILLILYVITCTHVTNNNKSTEIEMKYSIVQASSTYNSDNSHIYFKTHFVWKSVGQPKPTTAEFVERKSERRTCTRILLPESRSLFRLNRTEQTKRTHPKSLATAFIHNQIRGVLQKHKEEYKA